MDNEFFDFIMYNSIFLNEFIIYKMLIYSLKVIFKFALDKACFSSFNANFNCS